MEMNCENQFNNVGLNPKHPKKFVIITKDTFCREVQKTKKGQICLL